MPSVVDGLVEDLVAQVLGSSQLYTRLSGIAAVIGADEIEHAKLTGRPLLIFATVTTWLRSGTRGALLVDWSRAGAHLDGICAILAPVHLARRLHDSTRRCWPQPLIAVPDEARHAAA